MIYDTIKDLREVPLRKRDFNTLRGIYGAHKHGTSSLYAWEIGCKPNYRLAAQIDLDWFHSNGANSLDWDDLIEEMDLEPDDRTTEDIRNDQLAMTLDKG